MSGTGTWYDAFGQTLPGATDGNDSYSGSDDADVITVENEFGEIETLPPAGGLGNDTMDGRGGDDFITGGAGDDMLLGGDGNDILQGGADGDTLLGGAGDDLLNGIPGNDWLHGGEGSDTVQMDGAVSGHSWVPVDGGWMVIDTDPSDGDDGSDFVASDVEWVEYTGSGEIVQTPCFTAGTRIMTMRGEVPVEALRAGDMLVTLGLAGPRLRPVGWVGRRRVECHRHPRPESVLPIRIRAGALGRGVPHRDLVLSPDHAILIEGALVPAGLLVDGLTILREVATRQVRYFHIELDAHDILLAEGAPAESWLDCGNRHQFENAGLMVALHADFAAPPPADGCAPRIVEGARLERIRAVIARRISYPGTKHAKHRVSGHGLVPSPAA